MTGVAVVVFAEALRLWGVHHIGVISRTRSDRLGPLVASGPFALVRNPLYLGNIMLWVGPFTTFHSAFVHANLNWTLGPFKYVLATPVFHRWHHTSLEEGGNTNFAGTFPIWDILFGTFRMPAGALPDHYGVDGEPLPTALGGQLVYPFKSQAKA